MKPPHLPEERIPAVTDVQLRQLLKASEGRGFTARRDTAIIRLLIDTGLRRSECVGITLDDLDLDDQVVMVVGKGRRPRVVPLAARRPDAGPLPPCPCRAPLRAPAEPMDRPARRHDRLGRLPGGRRPGRLGRPRALHPHQLCHSFASSWLDAGGTEGDPMRLAGWKTRTMVDRYSKATADKRARAAYNRLGLGDRI